MSHVPKAWGSLAANELVSHAEVALAVSQGHLYWQTWDDNIPPYTFPGPAVGTCYTRTIYAAMVEHNPSTLAASGIGMHEHMTRAQMAAYAVAPVVQDPVVSNFTATHTFGGSVPCSTLRVVLSWTNPPNDNQPKILEWSSNDGASWNSSGISITAGMTSTHMDMPYEGFYMYRIRVGGTNTWVVTSEMVNCIE
jgi:hypothetical protein